MILKILTIDENPSYSLELTMLLQRLGHRVVAATNTLEGIEDLMISVKPDLIIINVYLEGEPKGLAFGEEIKSSNIPMVYITENQDRKLYERAKQTNIYGYIIQPFNPLTLESIIESIMINQGNWARDQSTSPIELDKVQQSKGSLFIREQSELYNLRFEDIDYIKSEGNYCVIHTNRKNYVIKSSLKRIVQQLPETIFIQIHRGIMINLNKIKNIDMVNNEIVISESALNIGRKYRKELIGKLDIL